MQKNGGTGMTDRTTLVYDANEVVVGPGDGSPLTIHEDAAIAIVGGDVVAIGPSDEITREYPPENATTAIDATGRAILPGFVDPHTHAVFAGDRSDEFAAKLRGKTYQEIHEEGGGILRTVRAVREASDERLVEILTEHLDTMLAHGTTTAEVKSGYGLDTDTELRLLAAIDRAAADHPIDIHPTFMGAHAVPEGHDADEYVDEVIDEQLPAVAEQGIAAFCDVFCEEGVFDVEQSRRVLEAGREQGLTPKVHAEEFTRLGGTQLAAEVEAASADHLLHATREDADALAETGVVPTFLPGTAFALGEEYADPEPFRAAGTPIALATDFNPNCHSRSVPFAVALGCVGMGLTPAEAIRAATADAAQALDRRDDSGQADPSSDGAGTLQEGRPGDLVVIDAPSHVHVPYRFGENPVRTVCKEGEIVHER